MHTVNLEVFLQKQKALEASIQVAVSDWLDAIGDGALEMEWFCSMAAAGAEEPFRRAA